MYYKYSDSELRSICKEKIESLEYWLRRAIDEILTDRYGDYLNYSDEKGNKLINNKIQKSISERMGSNPGRYSRPIDAVLLDDLICIICNPNLFKENFFNMLKDAFPDGREEAKTFMDRLITPRNFLSHANPISMRQVERVICYSKDIIDSIKKYNVIKNKEKEYNVPLILKVIDSFGKVYFRNQMKESSDGIIQKDFRTESFYDLRPGDTLSLEVEIDPSFSEGEYKVSWECSPNARIDNGKKAIIKITESQVGIIFSVSCLVQSNKQWHRIKDYDDLMIFKYKVLPPTA